MNKSDLCLLFPIEKKLHLKYELRTQKPMTFSILFFTKAQNNHILSVLLTETNWIVKATELELRGNPRDIPSSADPEGWHRGQQVNE